MSTAIDVVSTTLLLSFILCCVLSGVLQVFAWSRHARADAPVSFRALWNPEPFFDEIGLRQIGLARRFLIVGAAAYLSYIFLYLVTSATTP